MEKVQFQQNVFFFFCYVILVWYQQQSVKTLVMWMEKQPAFKLDGHNKDLSMNLWLNIHVAKIMENWNIFSNFHTVLDIFCYIKLIM